MQNLIRMDFRRLFKSKLFYLMMGIAVLLSIFMMAMFAVYSFALDNINLSELNSETISLLQSTLPSDFTGYMEVFFMGNYVILYIIILMAVFCNTEYSKGYIKNIASLVTPRYLLVLSKLIITVFVTVVIYLLVGLVAVVGCSVTSIGITTDNVAGIVKMLLVGMLMNVSLTSFVLMLFYIARKLAPALISGIVYITMGSVVYAFINLLVKAVFNTEKFDITEYTNLGNLLGHVNTTASNGTYIRAAVVAIVILALSVFISCLSVQKKDVK